MGTGAPPAQVNAVVDALAAVKLPVREAVSTGTPAGTGTHAAVPTRLAIPSTCRSSCAVTPLIDHALTYDRNPIKAARAVAEAFAASRGKVSHHTLDPTGVAVRYTVNLTGLAGRETLLEWSLWSRGGPELPQPWLRSVIAAEIKPRSEDQTVSHVFWIPTPSRHGNYVVDLTVYDSDGEEYGYEEATPPFH